MKQNKFNQIFKKNECDKAGHNYGTMYELVSNISYPKSILEIGFMHGASMMSWRDLFPECNLTALEINTNRPKKTPSDPFQLIEGHFMGFEPKQKYTWIIDDGSHMGDDVVNAFIKFWQFVKPGGFYIIEDVHCGFWKEYNVTIEGLKSQSPNWYKNIERIICNYTHRNGVETLESKTGFVIEQKSIIAIQKPL